jgi:hypothetical protein
MRRPRNGESEGRALSVTGSDEDLMEAFYAGDDDAFDEIFRRYHLLLAGCAMRLLPSGVAGRGTGGGALRCRGSV